MARPARGRPVGSKTDAVWQALQHDPMTRLQLAQTLQLSYQDAHNSLNRLQEAGLVDVIGYASTGGRPAAVYSAHDAQPSIDSAAVQFGAVFQSWARSGGGES